MAEKDKSSSVIYAEGQFAMPVGRLFFGNYIFEPGKPFKEGDEPKYSITIGYPPETEFVGYKKALAEILSHPALKGRCIKKGSDEEAKLLAAGYTASDITYQDEFIQQMQKPLKKEMDPDKLEKYPFMAGQFIFKSSSKLPPPVVGPDKKLIRVNEKDKLYNGVYVAALVSLGYVIGSKILFAQLNGVQYVRPGDPLSTHKVDLELFEFFAPEKTETVNLDDLGI